MWATHCDVSFCSVAVVKDLPPGQLFLTPGYIDIVGSQVELCWFPHYEEITFRRSLNSLSCLAHGHVVSSKDRLQTKMVLQLSVTLGAPNFEMEALRRVSFLGFNHVKARCVGFIG